jgi:beta-xylosidase
MKISIVKLLVCLFVLSSSMDILAQTHKAPAPLFRDPVTDGAADPVVVWNRAEKAWWILYTQRRANVESADVAYCNGNPIGIAESTDNGRSWYYRGTLDLKIDRGMNTFWAPDIAYDNGLYHLFVVYIKGVHNDWGGQRHIVHFTSKNLWDWKYEGTLKLSSDYVIDPTLFKLPNGMWRLWYKDERAGSAIMAAESKDLFNWTTRKLPAIGKTAQEGAKVFKFENYYWMVTDEWHGLRVYRSTDLLTWEKQGLILDEPGTRPDDHPQGAHADVIVAGGKAYIVYFTHPGRKIHTESPNDENGNLPYKYRRSSLQVAQLDFVNGTLTCDRNKDFDFYLPDVK